MLRAAGPEARALARATRRAAPLTFSALRATACETTLSPDCPQRAEGNAPCRLAWRLARAGRTDPASLTVITRCAAARHEASGLVQRDLHAIKPKNTLFSMGKQRIFWFNCV